MNRLNEIETTLYDTDMALDRDDAEWLCSKLREAVDVVVSVYTHTEELTPYSTRLMRNFLKRLDK
jgi:hypothetical protein